MIETETAPRAAATTAQIGFVTGAPRLWLRFEGLAVFLLATLVYFSSDGGWLLYLALFFLPDLSFAGYLAGARIGAVCYNVVHTYALPMLWLALGAVMLESSIAIPLIWLAHVGFDRMLGYGLKYPTAFQDTHLGRIGR